MTQNKGAIIEVRDFLKELIETDKKAFKELSDIGLDEGLDRSLMDKSEKALHRLQTEVIDAVPDLTEVMRVIDMDADDFNENCPNDYCEKVDDTTRIMAQALEGRDE